MVSWLVQFIFGVLYLAILARVLFSWIRPDPYNPLVRFVVQITDPILRPLQRYIPPIGMLDISPLIALLLISIIERVLLSVLRGF
jgi:YggT family protein